MDAETEKELNRLNDLLDQYASSSVVLQALVVSLMRQHPDRDSILARFRTRMERFQAMALHSTLPRDEWLSMLQLATDSLIEDCRAG